MFRIFLWLCVVLLVSCGRDEVRRAAPLDDLGRVIRIDRPVGRIVSLAPSLTEMLFALDAGDRVVGRTEWGTYPPEVSQIESMGNGLAPNVEVVAERDPDLVLLYTSSANAPALAQFATLGIPNASFRLDSLGDVARVARAVGSLVGREQRADSLAQIFARDLEQSRSRSTGDAARCRVAIVVWDSPPMVIGNGSFLTEIVELAAGRNVFGDVESPDAEVGIETIASRDPDVILVLGDEIPAYADRLEWQVVPAVKNRAFVLVEGSMFEYPSFRSLEAVQRLGERLGDCPG